jgi:hypothetical protein
MDEFAQSRADEDLFDDDFVPIGSTEGLTGAEIVTKQVQDISLENAPKGPSSDTHHRRGYDSRGTGTRGRGGRDRGVERTNSRQPSSSLLQSKHAPPPAESKKAVSGEATTANPSHPSKPSENEPESAKTLTIGPEDNTNPVPAPPTEPSTPARPPAVQGDRTATGGIKKPKLTEEELTAKLAAAKTRSENLSAAHARAEADAASFAEREVAAAEKRLKDTANRKVMEGEREKNRVRKMAVMGGREWDAEKNEEEFRVSSRGRGRGTYTRGANGGVRTSQKDLFDDDLRQYQWKDDRGGGRGRTRREGRGNERGSFGGRTDRRSGAAGQLDIKVESDFPALPATAKPTENESFAQRPAQNRGSSAAMSPTTGAGSWADQVEVSEAARPKVGR